MAPSLPPSPLPGSSLPPSPTPFLPPFPLHLLHGFLTSPFTSSMVPPLPPSPPPWLPSFPLYLLPGSLPSPFPLLFDPLPPLAGGRADHPLWQGQEGKWTAFPGGRPNGGECGSFSRACQWGSGTRGHFHWLSDLLVNYLFFLVLIKKTSHQR